MATQFDFKAATPDTTFPANGFLFGADSQSASDPSIYSHTAYLNYILSLANTWAATQTIAPAANTNALAVTGYSLTGSNAQSLVDLAGTWNTTGTPTAFKINVTDTASNAASRLMDLQTGGTSRFVVSKAGYLTIGAASDFAPVVINIAATSGSPTIAHIGTSVLGIVNNGGSAVYPVAMRYALSSTPTAAPDILMERDAANILALRNGANAQTFRVYNTYTDASNYERASISWSSNVLSIATQEAGTGTARDIQIGRGRAIVFPTIGGWQMRFSGTLETYLNWDAFTVRSDTQIGFASSTTVPTGAGDTTFIRSGAAIIGVRGSNTTTPGAINLYTYNASPPAAPSASQALIYADTSGGKIRLMAIFPSGAAQQIAIEP